MSRYGNSSSAAAATARPSPSRGFKAAMKRLRESLTCERLARSGTPIEGRFALRGVYLQGFSCLHALMRKVWPRSPPSQPEKGQSLMILGFTTTSMCTSKSGMTSKFSNL